MTNPPRQRRQKGENALFQDKTGRWICRYSYKDPTTGKRRKISGTGESPTIARNRLRDNMTKRFGAEPTYNRGIRLIEAYKLWEKDRRGLVTATTIERERSYIEDHIAPDLHNPRITELTKDGLKTYFYQTLDQSQPSAVFNRYEALRTLLNWCVKEEHLDKNPLARVPVPVVKKSQKLKAEDRSISMYSELIGHMVEKMREEPESPLVKDHINIRNAVDLQFTLGLRAGELLGITLDCLEYKSKSKKPRTLIIKQQLQYGEGADRGKGLHIVNRTKNGRERRIPLPPKIADIIVDQLELRKKIRPAKKWENLLFINELGQPYHPKKWSSRVRLALTDYQGDTPRGEFGNLLRSHLLRHIAATRMYEAGIDIQTAQAVLGHSDKAMTIYYTHQTDKNTINNLKKL